MHPHQIPNLLYRLQLAGLTLRLLEGDQIEVLGDGLTDQLRQEIRSAKPELLYLLTPSRPPVVNIRDCPPGWETDPVYVYIGRGGRGELKQSPFHNPYKARDYGGREQVVQMYRDRLDRRPELVAKARAELGGKVLVCHCKPAACHGDCLAELFLEDYELRERLAIQTEPGESLPELIAWFERRDRWREDEEPTGVLAIEPLAGYPKRIAQGGQTPGDSDPIPLQRKGTG